MQESYKLNTQEPKSYTLLLVGYWLRPEEFGFVCSLLHALPGNLVGQIPCCKTNNDMAILQYASLCVLLKKLHQRILHYMMSMYNCLLHEFLNVFFSKFASVWNILSQISQKWKLLLCCVFLHVSEMKVCLEIFHHSLCIEKVGHQYEPLCALLSLIVGSRFLNNDSRCVLNWWRLDWVLALD
jgi:hypothetical protein